jgi:hypothetical protein
VPSTWEVEAVQLHLERWEAYEAGSGRGAYVRVAELRPQRSQDDTERWIWDAGLQPPGAYLAIVQPFYLCHTFPREPATEESTEIQVPEPAEVHVRLFDGRTAEPVTGAWLGWYGAPPPQPSGLTTSEAELDPETGSFGFRAPVGEIVLVISGSMYGLVFEPAFIAPGSNDLEVRLDARCDVEVSLMDGALLVSPAVATRLQARPLDGEGAMVSWGRSNTKLSVLLDQPGLWELTVVDLPEGYLAAGPILIEARQGETVHGVVSVVRSH